MDPGRHGLFHLRARAQPCAHRTAAQVGDDKHSRNVGFAGSILFALFLVGWGLSFVWGPLADRFGRTPVMAATIIVYSVFTGVAALSQTVWQLAAFRLLAGIGIGGEWALAGTYVAEAWPEDRRKMGAGYLQTGYYAGFFLASALDYTVGARYGWRAMFLCGLAPVVLAFLILRHVKEPERWRRTSLATNSGAVPLRGIFSGHYRKRTLVNTALLTVAIVGLWAGAVYEPTAIVVLATNAGMTAPHATRMVSVASGILAVGTILGCLLVPPLAERLGRKPTLGIYFLGMGVSHPSQLRVGLLSAAWSLSIYHGIVLPGIFRRQLRPVQPLAA